MAQDDGKTFWQRMQVSSSQQRYIFMLLVLSAIGIGAIIMGNVLEPESKASEGGLIAEAAAETKKNGGDWTALAQEEARLAEDLTNALSQIQGVGRVTIKVTLKSSVQKNYATENQSSATKTNDGQQNGNSRTTEENRQEEKLAMQNLTQGVSQPVMIAEERPQAIGVLVVAEGADNLALREQLSSAVQILLDIPAHKVTVLPMEKEENR